MKRILIAAVLAAATPALADIISDTAKKKNEAGQQTQPKTNDPNQQPPGQLPSGPMSQMPDPRQQQAQPTNADQAKIAFDVALVEMQAGKLYLAGLADLAQKPTTWDRNHTVHLFNEAQQAVIRAEKQLDNVAALAQGQWANAGEQVRRAKSGLVETEQQLRSFSEPIRGGVHVPAASATIKNLWNSIDRAQKELESAAGTMGVDTKLKGL